MKGARHVSGGRRGPRDVLHMAALSATIRNAEMKALCGRLRERGGHREVALAGVMRRPVATASALPRDRRMREKRMGESATRGSGTRKPSAPSSNRLQTGRDVSAGGVNASDARAPVDRAVDGLWKTESRGEKSRKKDQIPA